MNVREVFDRYLAHGKATGIHSQKSREQREARFNLFCAWGDPPMGQRKPADCMPHHLEDFILSRERWYSTATKKAVVDQVRAAFNWAVRGRRIPFNPFDGVSFPDAEPRQPMPDDVLDRICDRAHWRFRQFVRFLRLTGRRLGEICVLEWSHIRWELSCAVLPPHLHKAGKKTRKCLTIPLIPAAMEMLKKIKAEDYHDGVIFRNTLGGPWSGNTLGKHLRHFKGKYKVDSLATLHGIRHTVGTEMIRNGVSLTYASKALGHAKTAITEKYYVHVDNDLAAMQDALTRAQK